jgi:hypothetical protein
MVAGGGGGRSGKEGDPLSWLWAPMVMEVVGVEMLWVS